MDWLKNVRAAGRAAIGSRGETRMVAEPEVLDRGAARSLLPWHARLLFDLAGIERYLKLKWSEEGPGPGGTLPASARKRGAEGDPER